MLRKVTVLLILLSALTITSCSKMENLKHLEELSHLQIPLEFLERIVTEKMRSNTELEQARINQATTLEQAKINQKTTELIMQQQTKGCSCNVPNPPVAYKEDNP